MRKNRKYHRWSKLTTFPPIGALQEWNGQPMLDIGWNNKDFYYTPFPVGIVLGDSTASGVSAAIAKSPGSASGSSTGSGVGAHIP